MKVIAERCGICLTWRWLVAHKHCANCGAYHVVIGKRHTYYNVKGVEMIRGCALPIHATIERLEAR